MTTLAGTRAALVLAVLSAVVTHVALAQIGPVPVPKEQTGLPADGRPDLRPERVAGEIVAGTYAGVAGYFIGRGIGTVATRMMSSDQDRARDGIVHAVGIVGAAFAIGGTVYAIGDMGSESGSFPATMGGVAAGAGVSLALSHLIFRGRVPANKASAMHKWWFATLECSLPAIGATIAFNSSRRWQR